ncbi:unnamed protein product [Ectocarpus sp. CCAP 1310/34]|nr:unnamed protein product [Ectocarpus sp. CCAP 1310/34]
MDAAASKEKSTDAHTERTTRTPPIPFTHEGTPPTALVPKTSHGTKHALHHVQIVD